MIPQRNVSLLSNRLAADGEPRIREDVLERDYCLAWLLNALAGSDLHPILAFKGGTALKRCYFADYRFSEDLDFTLREALAFEDIRARLERVYAKVQEHACGVQSSSTFVPASLSASAEAILQNPKREKPRIHYQTEVSPNRHRETGLSV